MRLLHCEVPRSAKVPIRLRRPPICARRKVASMGHSGRLFFNVSVRVTEALRTKLESLSYADALNIAAIDRGKPHKPDALLWRANIACK